MEIIDMLNVIVIALVFLILGLAALYVYFLLKSREQKDPNTPVASKGDKIITAQGTLSRESIYEFMGFDEIKDNMIVIKKGEKYVMIIQCQGVNYDLMSEDEKNAVEEGFVEFLNTIRFPIQLYVQTRSLNLRDIIEEYKGKVKKIKDEIDILETKLKDAQLKGNVRLAERLEYDKKRKQNVLEYGMDISEYVSRMSLNKNVLQQKNYVVVTYFASELGNIANYSKEEIDSMAFSELYIRCQSVIRSLTAAEVTGKVLDSEELAELLYIAYNRDEAEALQLSRVLASEYDALYSTSRDVLTKKQELLEERVNKEAVELATDSMLAFDKKRNEPTEEEMIEDRALEIVEEYKDEMDEELYEGTKKEIKQRSAKAKKEAEATKKRTTRKTADKASE